jgi:hypothetical protein
MEATLFGPLKIQLTNESAKTWVMTPNNATKISGHDPYVLEFFFKKLIAFPKPVVLDIGAHTGMFSLMTYFYPQALFYSFEPAPEAFRMLNDNIVLNKISDRVKTYNLALANHVGFGKLKVPVDPGNYGLAVLGNPLRLQNYTTVEVPVDTLDNFATKHEIPKVNLIKMDTEGCELLILTGGEKFIRRHLPDILTENYLPSTAQFGHSVVEVTNLLQSWGYQSQTVGSEDQFFTHPDRAFS